MGSGRRYTPLLCALALSVLVASSTWAEEPANPGASDAGPPRVLDPSEASTAADSSGPDPAKLPWAVTVYGGVFMDTSLGGMFSFDWNAQNSYLGVLDRKSTRLNSSHIQKSRMPSSA